MKNDPFHLFSNEKASLGILSVDGDFVRIISKAILKVNNIKNGKINEL